MNTLTIILAIYVALDIIASIIILIVSLLNGWTLREMALWLRHFLKTNQEDFIEDILYDYGDNDYEEEDYE